MRAVLLICTALLMTGCAANLTKGGSMAPLSIPAESRANLVVKFDGNDKVITNDKWGLIKTSWRNALQSEASTAGYSLTERAGPITTATQPGTMMLVEVSNFRYMTTGMRYGLGIMAGNAWINSRVTYLDLQTGEALGTRTYDTSSSAWEGVFSAMTEDQLQAIAKEMVGEIRAAKVVSRPAPAVAAAQTATRADQSKQQQLQQLMQQNRPYDEYQKRYRQIMFQ